MKAFQLIVALAAMFAITSSSFAGDAKKTAPAPAPEKQSTQQQTPPRPAGEKPAAAKKQNLAPAIWSKACLTKDPIGYVNKSRETMVSELELARTAWKALAEQIVIQHEKQRSVQQDSDSAESTAKRLLAKRCGPYPVSVGDTSIVDVEAVDDRISLLIAEVDGFGATLIKMRAVKRTASRTLETLKQRINDMDACVVTIDTQLLLIKALRLPNDSEVLAQQIFLICPNLPETATEHEKRMIQWKAENCRQEQKRQSNAPAPPGEKRSSAPKKTQCETPAKKKTRKLFAQSN